jgi:hypothetical protein
VQYNGKHIAWEDVLRRPRAACGSSFAKGLQDLVHLSAHDLPHRLHVIEHLHVNVLWRAEVGGVS